MRHRQGIRPRRRLDAGQVRERVGIAAANSPASLVVSGDPAALEAAIRLLRYCGIPEKMTDITADTLILVGGPGGMVDPVKLVAMTAAIPRCRVVRFRSGHSIHRDRYNDFATTVMPFLQAT